MKSGEVVGRHYRIEEAIGRGGMAIIYRAQHTILGSQHAIKVLNAELVEQRNVRDRFLREGRLQAQLQHPNLVTVTEVINEPGVAGLVMEYLQGSDLCSHLEHATPPVETATRWMLELLSTLSFIHAKQIIHRDIKPANIFLQGSEQGPLVRLMDFGIAQDLNDRQTQLGAVMGTPAYMPPEQRAGGALDHRADLFAAGAVFLEMLCGHQSWTGDIRRQDLAALPSPLQDILRTALSPEVTERFASAEQFAARIRALQQPSDTPATLADALEGLDVTITAAPCLTLAAWQNAIPLVPQVKVDNQSAASLEDITVRLQADPAVFAPWSADIAALQPGGTLAFDNPELVHHPAQLRAQRERERVVITAEVTVGGRVLATHAQSVFLLAPNEWPGAQQLPDLLAAFVQPNEPALQPILQGAKQRLHEQTGDPSQEGYQSTDPERIRALVQTLYDSVQATGMTYINPPASFEESGQKVRLPAALLQAGQGTCLDISVLMASLMEQIGLHPLLLVVKGHIFPGVWLTEFTLKTPVIDDATPILRREELREALLFDSSAMVQRKTFAQAIDIASRAARKTDSFRFALDIKRAREHKINPISLADAPAPAAPSPLPPAVSADEAPLLPPRPAPETVPLESKERIEKWKGQLLDLSLRNRLLNFRTTKRSLSISSLARLDIAYADLVSGKTLSLREKPAHLSAEDPRAISHEELLKAEVEAQQSRQVLVTTNVKLSVLQERTLELYRQTRTALQESGAVTLYFTFGMLHWFESAGSKKPRQAPLVLVPVELIRPRGESHWKLKKADSALVNTTLIKKLERDFTLTWSGRALLESEEDTETLQQEIEAQLKAFRKMVLSKPRWKVVDECHVARFSFTKFLMWRDLDARTADLLNNEVVKHILNTKEHASYPLKTPLVEVAALDQRDAQNVLTTMDADPTQLQAIFAAEDGNSFVLQGPPGTGKSQTITNMISALLGQGKTVLFVSEKMAALDVVYSRLSRVGLGRFCLKLHSNKSNKKQIILAIAQALQEPAVAASEDWKLETKTLTRQRKALNDFAAFLAHKTPFQESNHHCIARHIALKEAPEIDLSPGDPEQMSRQRLNTLIENVGHLVAVCQRSTAPAAHPWRGVGLTSWSPAKEKAVRAAVSMGLQRIEALQAAAEAACEILRLPPEDDPQALQHIRALCEALLESPPIPDALLSGAPHQSNVQRLERWSQDIRRRREGWSSLSSRYAPALLQADLGGLQSQYRQWASAFFLVAFFMLWSARKTLRRLAPGGLPSSRQIATDLTTAIAVREQDTTLASQADAARSLLGPLWQGSETDLAQVQTVLDAAGSIRRHIVIVTDNINDESVSNHLRSLAGSGRDRIAAGTRRYEALDRLRTCHDAWLTTAATLQTDLRLDEPLSGSLATAQQRLTRLHEHPDQFRDWVFMRSTMDEARAVGLGSLVDALSDGEVRPEQLEETFSHAFYRWWVMGLFEKSERLQRFRGIEHDELVEKFQHQDRQIQARAQREIISRLLARRPSLQAAGRDTSNEMGLLKRQLGLSRGHMPIRRLFGSIPESLRRLKPCMLMSPLSVAQYLDPALKRFDVVIFDEASQIPPWDALGAIARGNQVVIVGDSRQLPPTSFFSSSTTHDDEDDEQDMVEMESILEEAAARMHNLRLKWHYRSQHESLIAFSNQKYYDNELLTFPAADSEVPGLGVVWRHVPDGFYDRGRKRTNQAEAKAIVDALYGLLMLPDDHRPTVGIVTFSMAQQRLVENLTDALRLKHPALDRFFDGKTNPEPVFIKNLENVQGDERDVMLFSICYGPDRHGKIAMNFGPLNLPGGERRLNVAITRARRQLIVFSTLRADQIDLRRTRAAGARHLKAFLDYASRGVMSLSSEQTTPSQGITARPFEDIIQAKLEERGWSVHTQIGCSGYRIDLGVVDPQDPGRYLLGVECDGATYHDSRCARERDRLRQGVLEGLGWRMHRVWITDWWINAERELKRLEDAIAQAQAAPRTPPLSRVAPPLESTPEESPSTIEELLDDLNQPRALPDWAKPYAIPSLPVRGDSDAFYDPRRQGTIAAQLQQVVSENGPIHLDDAVDIIRVSWGFGRSGRRIRATIEGSMAELPAASRPILTAAGWLWPKDIKPTSWRRFRTSEADSDDRRRAQRICTAELANAAGWVLEGVKSLSEDALCRETALLFGFKTLGTSVRREMMRGVEHLLKTQRARRHKEMLVILD